MTLTTATTVTLDRLQYTVQIRSVSVELALLPGINHAEVAIAAGVKVEAEPGAPASVSLDGGDGAATVITGFVDRVDRQPSATVVTVTDAGAALARIRPHETFDGLLATQIIMKLAKAAGVETGVIVATMQSAAFVADPHRTGAQHVAALADRSGAVAFVDSEGRLTALPWPVGIPTAAMRLDREFTSMSAWTMTPGSEAARVGSGGSGIALSPDAWVQSTDPVTGADDPAPGRRWQADHLLRTNLDVALANEGATARRGARANGMTARCWLQPARRPGDVVQIQETNHDSQAGPWLISRVRHDLSWDKATTELQGVTAGDTGDLLGGALAGAASAGGFL